MCVSPKRRSYELQLAIRACPVRLPRGWASGTHTAVTLDNASALASTAAAAAEGLAAPATDSSSGAGTSAIGLEDSASAAPITWLCCPPDGHGAVHACFGGHGAGHVWECNLDGAAAVSHGCAIKASPTTILTTSRSGAFKLMGSVDGLVRIELADAEAAVASGPR